MPFTYAGPYVSAAFTAGVFNDAWTLANQRATDATMMSESAVMRASTPERINSTPIVAAPDIPTAPLMSAPMSIADATALYGSTAAEIQALLTNGFTSFIQTYFGSTAEFTAAQAWLNKALTTGGTGLSADVERRIYNRDKDRVLGEAARAEQDVLVGFSNKRYTVPPGAAMAALARIRKESNDRLASNSRDIVIQQATMELENVRIALSQAIGLRTSAIQAAGDYVRTLALGPQTGATVATALLDVQARTAQTLAAFYGAQVTAAELPLKASLANAEMLQRTNEANQRAGVDAMGQRVQATLAAAQSLGTQAAAALNGLHAGTSFSGGESA
jgi:hypothetical protein